MADIDIDLRPLPASCTAYVPGPYVLLTVGHPPNVVAVVRDADIAVRVAELLERHGMSDLDELPITHQGDPR